MSVPDSLRFTYEDYVLLPEDRRHEVIDGELYVTPAPTPYHQLVKQRTERFLLEHVDGHALGQTLDAPCAVSAGSRDPDRAGFLTRLRRGGPGQIGLVGSGRWQPDPQCGKWRPDPQCGKWRPDPNSRPADFAGIR